MEILTGFYLVSSVLQNITFLLPIIASITDTLITSYCSPRALFRKIYFDKLMLIENLTHYLIFYLKISFEK